MEANFLKKQYFANSGILLYFLAILLATQAGGRFVSLFWIGSVVYAAIAGIYSSDGNLDWKVCLYIITIAFTGSLNCVIVGTSSVNNQVLLLLLLFTALSLNSKYINDNTLLAVFFLNIAIVLFKYLTVGFRGQIYTTASSNFVSVYLLYPIVSYYVLCERKGKTITVTPAFLLWVFSLLARGRGGIIATTFLFLCILIICRNQYGSLGRLISWMIVILGVSLVVINIESILFYANNSVIMEYFRDRGLSSSRSYIWADYFRAATKNKSAILIGPDMKDTFAYQFFGGNPHNSFINIHKYNGLAMFLIVGINITRNLIISIKTKQYVYFICFSAFLLRAFTDNIFWPAYGSAVLFFLLFFFDLPCKQLVPDIN